MNFDLVTVRAFLAVVEQRHYGRAAEALGVSVSAVTKRVQRLEADLGVPLLERDSGGVVDLTPAGRRFVQFAPQVLQSAQEAQMVVTDGATMTLRIGVPAGVPVVAPLMPSALATLELALSHAHPGVVTALKPTPFQRLTADLLEQHRRCTTDVRGVAKPRYRVDAPRRTAPRRHGRSNPRLRVPGRSGRARVRYAADGVLAGPAR